MGEGKTLNILNVTFKPFDYTVNYAFIQTCDILLSYTFFVLLYTYKYM